jgi:hypothetical protein
MGTWIPAGWENVPDPPNEIVLHTVLAQPQAPMNVPWDPVLNIACKWMNRASTELAAQRKLTERMMGVKYDLTNQPYIHDLYAVWYYMPVGIGALTYTRWVRNPPPAGPVEELNFYLRKWLNDSSNGTLQMTGQCTDVSALWVIMAKAVCCPRVLQVINNPDNSGDDFYYNPGFWAGHTTEGLLPSFDSNTGRWYPYNLSHPT